MPAEPATRIAAQAPAPPSEWLATAALRQHRRAHRLASRPLEAKERERAGADEEGGGIAGYRDARADERDQRPADGRPDDAGGGAREAHQRIRLPQLA